MHLLEKIKNFFSQPDNKFLIEKTLFLFLGALFLGSIFFLGKSYLGFEGEMLTAGLFDFLKKDSPSAARQEDNCLNDSNCTEFFYDGGGGRIGKRTDEDNYTLYITPLLQKQVVDGKVIWRKFYTVKGQTKAVRVIIEDQN